MNAKEARAKAEGIQTERAKTQYDDIQKKIKEAVLKNDFKCFYYDPIIDGVKYKLESEGFGVKSDWHRNEYLATISW